MNWSWREKKRFVKVIQDDCLRAKLVTSSQARAIEMPPGFPKNNGLFAKKTPGEKFSIHMLTFLFGLPWRVGWGWCCGDNNKLAHEKPFSYLWIPVPRNSKLESIHWQFYMRFEKLDIVKTNFYNPTRLSFHLKQYCPEQENLKENGLKYPFM